MAKDGRLEVRLTSEEKEALKVAADERGQSMAQVLLWLFREWDKAGRPKHIKK